MDTTTIRTRDSERKDTGKTERILRLLQLLSVQELTRQEIFEHLASYYENSERMFERDIKLLHDFGFVVQKKKARGKQTRYHLAPGSSPIAMSPFSTEEVDSLAFLYNIFADPARYTQNDPLQPLPSFSRNPFADNVLQFLDKLAAILPEHQKQHFQRSTRKPFLYFNLSPAADYLSCREIMEKIIRAITHRQQIAFDYHPAHRRQKTITHTRIDPYYILYMEEHFYLIAYSHKMNDFFEYRIDRIEPSSFQQLHNMIDGERRRRPIEFRFWINANIAKPVLSQRWLSHTLEREESYIDEKGNEQRRILVHAFAYSSWRVRQQLLKYGKQAELVEPQDLREKMRTEVKQMAGLYENKQSV